MHLNDTNNESGQENLSDTFSIQNGLNLADALLPFLFSSSL